MAKLSRQAVDSMDQQNPFVPDGDSLVQRFHHIVRVLESEDGEPFRFAMTYPSASDTYKSMMLLLKDLYVRAGILMELNPVEWPILIEALNTKDFDAISLGWSGDFEIDVYQNMHSSQTEPGGDGSVWACSTAAAGQTSNRLRHPGISGAPRSDHGAHLRNEVGFLVRSSSERLTPLATIRKVPPIRCDTRIPS